MQHTRTFSGIAAALATAAAVHAQPQVVFVDDNAPLGGDGRTWQSAFNDLQDGLAVANVNLGAALVKIAQGVYRPDRGSLDRQSSFLVTSGVTLMGGFAGRGAPDPDERDPVAFVSVLTGDLRGNDTSTPESREDNSMVIIDAGRAQAAYFNGLTITSANGTSALLGASGGFGATLFLTDCTLKNNRSTYNSGAISGGIIGLFGCKLVDNFSGNVGGAVSCSNLTMSRCEVRGNTADFGAGVYVHGMLRVDSTLFAGNVAVYEGGAIFSADYTPTVRLCTFVENDARNGAAIHGSYWYANGESEITGNIFWGNILRTPSSRVIDVDGSSNLPFASNLVQGGTAYLAALGFAVAPSNISVDPRFVDPAGPDGNPLTTRDNNYRLRIESPCVDALDQSFENLSTADLDGGARSAAGGCICNGLTDLGCYELPAGSCSTPGARIFVRASAAPGGDGLSWPTALRSLQDAIRKPAASEIWVASGTYTPADGVLNREAVLDIACRMTFRGGFAGYETAADQRLPANAPTIISGDLRADDTSDILTTIDNSRDLVVIRDGDVIFDRVTFSGTRSELRTGNAGGAAMRLARARADLIDCRFTSCIGQGSPVMRAVDSTIVMRGCMVDNNLSTERASFGQAGYSSSGMINLATSTLMLNDCTLSANRTESEAYTTGGAISSQDSDVVATQTIFNDNAIVFNLPGVFGGFIGGAAIGFPVWSTEGSLSLTNCRFISNTVVSLGEQSPPSGGALYGSGRNWSIVGCEFNGNSVSGLRGAQGGAAYTYGWPVGYINCTFANNSAQGWLGLGRVGGVHWASGSSPTLTNCILWGNTDDVSPTQTSQLGAPPGTTGRATLSRCIVQGLAGSLGGQNNSGLDPLFESQLGADGLAGNMDDDLRLSPNSPAIDFGNSAALFAAATPTIDALGAPRFFNDVGTPDAGVGPSTTLDVGAFEFQGFTCRVDWDRSGVVDIGDVFSYISDFFAGGSRADFNRVNGPTLQDLFDFLSAYFTGCP